MEIRALRDREVLGPGAERRPVALEDVALDAVRVEVGAQQLARAQGGQPARRRRHHGDHRGQEVARPDPVVVHAVAHGVLAAFHAVDQGVPQPAPERVRRPERAADEEVAFRQPGDLHRIALRARDDLGVPAVEADPHQPRPDRCLDPRAVGIAEVVRHPSRQEVQAAVRAEAAAVGVVRDPRVGEPGQQLRALVADAVAVDVLQLPERRRGHAVHGALVPEQPLREDQLVGEDLALVEDAVAVDVLQPADAVRRILEQLAALEVHAGRIADVEAAAVVEARHDRPLDERRRGRAFPGPALGDRDLQEEEQHHGILRDHALLDFV